MTDLDPDSLCRKKLRGKDATNKDFALEVAKLSKGNPESGIRGMSDNEIATTLGYKHYTSIQGFKKLAKKLNYFNELDQPKINRSTYVMSQEINKFVEKYESLQLWKKDMKKRARGGKPFKGAGGLLRTFKTVCDTLEMHPDQFIHGSDRRQVLSNAEDCLSTFMDLYMEKKAKVTYLGKFGLPWNPRFVNQESVQYIYAKGIRDFMKSFGFSYPIGHGGNMHQSVKQWHGNFADVRFESWSQYRDMKKYIIKHHGLDSDLFRWFAIGVEALPRADAIFTMKNDFEPVMRGNKEYYVMQVFEKKTSQINNGIWEKYIVDADTKESINLVKKRGNFVIENRSNKYQKLFYPELRQMYKVFGLDKIKLEFDDVPQSGYFSTHTSHALRHCGAQLWLEATNWHVEFVASMGWSTTQELIDSYGRMDAQRRLKVLDGADFG